MSSASSPTFSGETDHFYEPNSFTEEISQRMRVPKRINVDGVSDTPNVHRNEMLWLPAETYDMHVPEKIVVEGEGLYGTRGIPREIALDNTIMPPDPGFIRVQTPPRSITIDNNYYYQDETQTPVYNAPVSRANGDIDRSLNITQLNDTTVMCEMPLEEEVKHLRKQLSRLNRRVMTLELENAQRHTKEKIMYGLGFAYIFLKTVIWLNRS